ncbi:transcriptional regulator [Balneicella halophila]|uniref:Transcriptional regulator n=1 Tax=Balneicella halophila TaxID=1537566 RepID=A0A7L4US73_BALHA|nr:sigma-54 dependent transcriptional regulator [Balneicella halophila]PVX52057.1 transcriptional regulator [Balneicella halophila]
MKHNIQSIKQRFGIIGNSESLERAINIAVQVAPTDLSVLVTGESGVGKEFFPQIVHQYSSRKHNPYIAVNCGAIPEGTIDSELFGHIKGSFTGALSDRKGYFQHADKGTIFLDEIAELPLATQARLLRVLESGEYIKVGSSQVEKTDVRIVAATNVQLEDAVKHGKFREDLYYRLNTVPIEVPALRDRPEDIPILFRRFAVDFADKYQMPPIRLTEDAILLLKKYRWQGNVRQLKNITEQISIIEKDRSVNALTLTRYLPENTTLLPALAQQKTDSSTADFSNEREILYKVLFDMRKDMNDLKKLVYDLMENNTDINAKEFDNSVLTRPTDDRAYPITSYADDFDDIEETTEIIEESLSLQEREKEIIIKALDKHNGKRKKAAEELGISERTLYRKIKEYEIN